MGSPNQLLPDNTGPLKDIKTFGDLQKYMFKEPFKQIAEQKKLTAAELQKLQEEVEDQIAEKTRKVRIGVEEVAARLDQFEAALDLKVA